MKLKGTNCYKEREIEILDKLNNGYTREEIYKEYGYVSWRSLDGFMRRKGYIYKEGTYQKPEEMREKMLEELCNNIPYKASLIVKEFEEKGGDTNPIEVARKYGFSGCVEMNNYMKENGLHYKSFTQKYEKEKEQQENKKKKEKNTVIKKVPIATDNNRISKAECLEDMQKYIPLLDFLSAHQEQLVELCNAASTEQLPRYMVPGTPKVKSIYISNMLIKILDDFVRSKNVTIKEICEGAIIQYLSKYGYKDEIALLLDKNNI